MISVTRKSLASGVVRTLELDISAEDLAKWEKGEGLIQNLFPNLTPDEREFIMTGVTKEEWDDAFKEEAPEDNLSGYSESPPV